MPEDDSTVGEHEVIESASALFRHLHEAHGVEEAAGLDPDSTPVEPWLRRHALLERAARRAARESRDGERPEPTARQEPSEPAAEPRAEPPAAGRRDRPRDSFGQGGRAEVSRGARVFDQQRFRQPPDERQRPARPGPGGQGQSGQPGSGRHSSGQARSGEGAGAAQGGGVRDPLVRALAAELVRLGHDERAVRRYVHRYVALTPEGGLTGEAGIRASFLDPILDVIAEQLDPTAGATRAGGGSQGDTGGDTGGGARGGGADDRRSPEEAQDDLMAIANVFRKRQAQRSAI